MVHYHCRHCRAVLGSLPYDSIKETLAIIKEMDGQEQEEPFLTYQQNGAIIVRCICERCEQVLQQFPDYYALEKWLQ